MVAAVMDRKDEDQIAGDQMVYRLTDRAVQKAGYKHLSLLGLRQVAGRHHNRLRGPIILPSEYIHA